MHTGANTSENGTAGLRLGPSATDSVSPGYRYREADFAAPTWAEAMRQAWDWAIGEVRKLEEALRVRQEALGAAECKACTPCEDPYVERPEEEAVRRLEDMNGP